MNGNDRIGWQEWERSVYFIEPAIPNFKRPLTALGYLMQAIALRMAMSDFLRAADLWRELGPTSLAHLRTTDDARQSDASLAYALGTAAIARDLRGVAEAQERSPQARPGDAWSGLVTGLVLDLPDLAADAADRHTAHITPDNWRKMKATPYVGEAATAILTDDQAATQGHLIAMLDSIVSARKKGHLRNHRTIHLEPALLWRIATERGMTITIPAIFHAVPLPFMVTNEFDFDGTPARGQRFTWPVDLLPIDFYNSLSPN